MLYLPMPANLLDEAIEGIVSAQINTDQMYNCIIVLSYINSN